MDRSETFLIETDRLDDGHLFEHLACKFQTDLEDLKNALGMARRLHGIVLDSSETRATDQMLKASEAARLAFGNGREAFGIPRKRASLWARPRSA